MNKDEAIQGQLQLSGERGERECMSTMLNFAECVDGVRVLIYAGEREDYVWAGPKHLPMYLNSIYKVL